MIAVLGDQDAGEQAGAGPAALDGQGRRWEESAGVNGVELKARVVGGGSVVSEPVFKVAGDATGLGLVFTHGRRQPGVLVIGDSDSLLHKKTVVRLGR